MVTDYCSLAELKAQLRITDTVDDAALAISITAASRAIDQYCNRFFGQDASTSARVYTYHGGYIAGRIALPIDDIMDTTGMSVVLDLDYDGVFDQALTLNVDYDMWPWNAPANSEPYTAIVLRPRAVAWFPWWARGVQVTAKHGWTAVPVPVKQACLIQASRFFMRRDSWYGVAGSPDVGSEIRLLASLDPDVQAMLGTVRRWWGLSSGD